MHSSVARVRRQGFLRRGVVLAMVTAATLHVAGSSAARAAAASAAPDAAAVNPSLFGELRWRSIGPYRGGRALAVAGIPGDASTFYFGAAAGGVWKTTDGGNTWQPLTDGTPISSIGAIAVAPSNHSCTALRRTSGVSWCLARSRLDIAR